MMRLLTISFVVMLLVSTTARIVACQDIQAMHQELETLKGRMDALDEENKYLRLKLAKEELTRVSQLAPEEKAGKGSKGFTETTGANKEMVTPSPTQFKVGLPEEKGGIWEGLQKPFRWKEKPEPMIKVGRGSLSIGGLFQGWFTHDELATVKDEFRLRRTEIKLYGEILPKFKYTIMFDPAKRFPRKASDSSTLKDNTDSSGVLQDAYVALGYFPHHELTLGQFKIPVVEEGFRSSSKIDFVERSIIARTFSDRRDPGIMLKGDYGFIEYYLAMVNGEETNAKDLNDSKDYMGRLVLKPFNAREGSLLKGLEFGGSYYKGNRGVFKTTKNFWGAEARYTWHKLTLKSEYVAARDDDSTLKIKRPIHKDGWYAQAGYRFFKPLEGLVRYEEFRPDTELHGNKQRPLTMGFNWFFDEHHAKFQVNYIRNLGEERDGTDDQILSAIQVAF